jgi:hypothetical protein
MKNKWSLLDSKLNGNVAGTWYNDAQLMELVGVATCAGNKRIQQTLRRDLQSVWNDSALRRVIWMKTHIRETLVVK